MAQTVSQPRPAAVAAVLAKRNQWTHATRKSDGKSFYFVPSCTAGTVYQTAVDGCTCPAARNSRTGDCKHQAAVRQATKPAVPKMTSYAALMARHLGDD
jgi:hypothetical protein